MSRISSALGGRLVGSLRPTYLRHLAHPLTRSFEDPASTWWPEGRFSELFAAHGGRVAHKWLHYFDIYDELFAGYLDGVVDDDGTRRPLRFLEIGVSKGGSLELWRSYFGDEAVIVGIDVNPDCALLDGDGLTVRIGSQDDTEFLRSVVAEMGGVDVVLDDGSHVAAHQRASFDVLFPMLSANGLYVIEDTCTAYWASFGGGYRRPGQIIEMAKSMVDGLTQWAHRWPMTRRQRLAAAEVRSISFYDGMLAVRKGRRRQPEVRRTIPKPLEP